MGKQRYGIDERELKEYAKKLAASKSIRSNHSQSKRHTSKNKSSSAPMFTVHNGWDSGDMKRTLEMLRDRIGEDALTRMLGSKSGELLQSTPKASGDSDGFSLSDSTKRKVVRSSLLGKEYVEKFLSFKQNGGKSK